MSPASLGCLPRQRSSGRLRSKQSWTGAFLPPVLSVSGLSRKLPLPFSDLLLLVILPTSRQPGRGPPCLAMSVCQGPASPGDVPWGSCCPADVTPQQVAGVPTAPRPRALVSVPVTAHGTRLPPPPPSGQLVGPCVLQPSGWPGPCIQLLAGPVQGDGALGRHWGQAWGCFSRPPYMTFLYLSPETAITKVHMFCGLQLQKRVLSHREARRAKSRCRQGRPVRRDSKRWLQRLVALVPRLRPDPGGSSARVSPRDCRQGSRPSSGCSGFLVPWGL